MKKKSLSLLTLVCALCLALFACRKEIGQLVNADTPNVSASKLEAAKIFNAKFIAQHISENAKIPGFVTLAPQWDQAWTVSATGGTEYIAVPTILDHVDQLNVTLSRLFLFEMKADQVVNAQIVEFVGLNYNVERNQNDLILNHKSASIAGFNGAIIHYDLNYRRTDGSIYEGGEIKLTNAAITRKETFNEPASDKKIPLYLSTLSKDSSGNYLISNYKYLFTPSGRLRIASGESGNGSGNASGMGGELSEVVIIGTPGGTSGGGGGGAGGNPPPTGGGGTGGEANNPSFAGIYAFGGATGNSDDGRLSCRSFTFKKLSRTANSQEAGIKQLNFVVYLPDGVTVRNFPLRTMYVNIGVSQANGNVISEGKAAEFAAHAANRAGASLTVKYGGLKTVQQIYAIQQSTIDSEFKSLFETCLQQEVQGYAAVTYNQLGSNTVTNTPVWNGDATRAYNWLTQTGCGSN